MVCPRHADPQVLPRRAGIVDHPLAKRQMPPDHEPKANLRKLGVAEHHGDVDRREQRSNAIACTTGEQVTIGKQPSTAKSSTHPAPGADRGSWKRPSNASECSIRRGPSASVYPQGKKRRRKYVQKGAWGGSSRVWWLPHGKGGTSTSRVPRAAPGCPATSGGMLGERDDLPVLLRMDGGVAMTRIGPWTIGAPRHGERGPGPSTPPRGCRRSCARKPLTKLRSFGNVGLVHPLRGILVGVAATSVRDEADPR